MFSSYQEAFDTTMLKLQAQGAFSFDPSSESCMYTDGSGNQCAFGIHFPPHYLNYMESSMVHSMYKDDPLVDKIRIDGFEMSENFKFWRYVQLIHDLLAEGKCIAEKLDALRQEFRIDTTLVGLITSLPSHQN